MVMEAKKKAKTAQVQKCFSVCHNVTSSVKYSTTSLRVRLHRTSESMLRQRCDDTSNSVLIENNGVPPDWGCNSTIFNENSVASVIAELLQR